MATVPQNLLKYSETNVWGFPNFIGGVGSTSGNVIHSGDMVYVDTPAVGTSTYSIIALDSDSHAAAFAGVSMDTYDPTNYAVYAGDPAPPNGMNVVRKGLWFPYTTSGQTYFPGNTVYIGANAQTITLAQGSTSGYTHAVGYVANPVYDPAGVGGYLNGLVGVGTNQVLCYIVAQWPATTV